jgi:RNA polymerase sigma factor for flagellar operon FliA
VVLARAYRPQHDVRRIDGMTREELCRRYQGRILRLARRAHEQSEEEILPLEDLVSHGVVGLLEAFDRYEHEYGTDFSAYAEYRIRGALLDALRSADPSTRRRRERAEQIRQATVRLQDLGIFAPSHEQVAREMGLSMEEYWQMLDQMSPVTLVPLEEALEIQQDPAAPRQLLAQEAREILRQSITQLPERERMAVLLYYGRDCSLAEVAVLFEVSPSRVCQLLSTARGRLKAALLTSIDIPSLIEEGTR